jgi:hypothetical protein
MVTYFWIACRPGEERIYTTTAAPRSEWRLSLEREGYTIFRIKVQLPENWDKSKELPGEVYEYGSDRL